MRATLQLFAALALASAVACPGAALAAPPAAPPAGPTVWAAVPPTVTPSVVTAAPDPAHPILSQAFQDETGRRSPSVLTGGNAVELLEDGVVSFPRKWALMRSAQTSLFVSTMSWRWDATGQRMVAELVAAARRGVDARAICDGLMCDPRVVERLRAGGVKVARYNLPWPFANPSGRDGRIHHKLIVADLSRAITGGMNVADKWALGDGLNDNLHDVDMAIAGYGAAEIARRFLELFAELNPADPVPAVYLAYAAAWTQPAPAPAAGRAGFARQLYSEPDKGTRHIEDYYQRAFAESKTQIVWYTMSLFPMSPLWPDMRAAASRGVRVVLVTQSERAMMVNAFYRWFQFRAEEWWARNVVRGSGIEIWELDVPLHAKAMTVDGVLASVGSFNCDSLSTDANTEGTIVSYDPAFVAAVERMLERDIRRARRVQ